jgi:hypothetical protein
VVCGAIRCALLPLVLDAAVRFQERPSDEAMREIAAQQAMEPLFG